MIKVSVFYPAGPNTKFDMTYYLERHMPMVQRLVGLSLKGMMVEQGVSGMKPDSPATYAAMGHLLFDSLEAFQSSFGPHTATIVGDVPNYTNTQPTIQISEVKL
jgi:uncharacterized protein (TIGR02118 family)